MNNKKGWLRIVEAFLAILLIAGVIFVIIANRTGTQSSKEEIIYNLQRTVLNEISSDKNLRDAVLKDDQTQIKDFISGRIPQAFNFTINICELNDVCPMMVNEYKKNVYANEVVISSTLENYNPKKLKLFMWEE